MKKKTVFLTILIVAITIVTALSVSYAYWAATKVQDSSNVIASDCLNITFNELSDAINLNRTYPGELSTYAFSINNTCNINVNYDVNLETLEGSTLDTEYLSTIVKGVNSNDTVINNLEEFENYANNNYALAHIENKLLNTYDTATTTITNSVTSNRITSSAIKPGEYHNYAISVLLDENSNDPESMNKTWMGKVIINSTTPSPIRITFDSNGGDMDVSSKLVYTYETYGELPKPTKEGYVFKYWYYDNDETKGINSMSTVNNTNDFTLKAKYVSIDTNAVLQENKFYRYLTFAARSAVRENYKANLIPFEGFLTEEEKYNMFGGATNTILSTNTFQCGTEETCRYAVELFEKYDELTNELNVYYYIPNANIQITADKFGSTMNVTNIDQLFKHLKKIDVSAIDTSLMTNMNYMFYACESLEEIVFGNFNTTNVTSMREMFSECTSLRSINLDGFNTGNVTNMTGMFKNCSSLTSIDLDGLNTTNVTSMGSMFEGCTNLVTIDISNFNTSNVTDMYSMFSGLEHIEELDLSSLNLSNVTNITELVAGDSELRIVTFSNTINQGISDSSMLCGTREDLEIIGYTPSEEARGCIS